MCAMRKMSSSRGSGTFSTSSVAGRSPAKFAAKKPWCFSGAGFSTRGAVSPAILLPSVPLRRSPAYQLFQLFLGGLRDYFAVDVQRRLFLFPAVLRLHPLRRRRILLHVDELKRYVLLVQIIHRLVCLPAPSCSVHFDRSHTPTPAIEPPYFRTPASCYYKFEVFTMRRRTFFGTAFAGLAAARAPKAKPGDIPTRVLGRTGEKLTIIGQGGARFQMVPLEEGKAVVRRAYDL